MSESSRKRAEEFLEISGWFKPGTPVTETLGFICWTP
jgi:hypothetical protein